MDLIIKRREIKSIGNWSLVYGRRKVGKTFMLRNQYNWDYYLTVGRDGSIWVDGSYIKKIDKIENFIDFVYHALSENKKVVIDEFQRLPLSIYERISMVHPSGTLILSGSSIRVVKEILSKNSPLLGLLSEHRIRLIHPQDLAMELKKEKELLDYMVYLRDPWLIPMMKGDSILKDLYRILIHTPYTVSSLIGEIFIEEDRKLTKTYEGIIRCIGSGVSKISQIASILYHRGIISKDSTSAVYPYIENLKEMGILKEMKIYGKRSSIYRMLSPIFTVFYYITDKYEIFDYEPPKFSTMKENIVKVHSMCYEDFIVELLSMLYNGRPRYSFSPEIDGIIVDRKERPIAVIEVKHGKVSKSEISKVLSKTRNISGKRIIVATNKIETDEVEILTPDDIVKMLREKF